MITKSSLLVVAMLLATLATPRSAADTISDECGLASVYSTVSEETASGEDTLPADFTAAHRSLPFGTLVTVKNQENARLAMVRITDRGPFIGERIIDVFTNYGTPPWLLRFDAGLSQHPIDRGKPRSR
jgi:rare lipoprotein A